MQDLQVKKKEKKKEKKSKLKRIAPVKGVTSSMYVKKKKSC
jgi:hypothetical protein